MRLKIDYIIASIFALLLTYIAIFHYIPYRENQKYQFRLQGADGTISLKDFRGKGVAIYFGYTYCPDICPTSLGTLASALNRLDGDEQREFNAIFVSVDPKRDSLKNLKEYASYYHPQFIGATANEKTIKLIADNYGTKYAFIEGNTAIGYTVSHTSFVYFFDKNGHLSSKLTHSVDIDETLEHIKKALL